MFSIRTGKSVNDSLVRMHGEDMRSNGCYLCWLL